MAGIGFVLRRLARQDNLMGIARSLAHSTVATAGTWLFTVCALAAITAMSIPLTTLIEVDNFRTVLIYNFAFTLVFCSPVLMIQTRYLADLLWLRDVRKSIGLLVGSNIVLFSVQFPIVTAFYFLYANMSLEARLASIANYMGIVFIWPVAVFLSALKDYSAVTWAFVLGLIIAVLVAGSLAPFGSEGVLGGFTVGLVFTSAILISRVFAEYPFRARDLFAFLPYFRTHKYVFFTGVAAGIAIWVDKWIMWWFAPEAERAANNLVTYPNYDSAMFAANFTIIPAMAVFMIIVETDFFENYLKFFRDIQKKATWHHIEKNHRDLVADIYRGARTLVLIQASVTAVAIAIAPVIFDAIGVNYLQLGIFRFGAIGSFFQIMSISMIIIISYFNNIKAMFYIYLFFAVTNASFTWLLLPLGFAYYGLGYALAGLGTFIFSSYIMISHAVDLPYHTFITSNTSVD